MTTVFEALPESGAGLAADVAATAAVVECVFGLAAASAADASVQFAAFLSRWLSAAPVSGDPGPVSAGVFGVPGPASVEAFPVAADISDLA